MAEAGNPKGEEQVASARQWATIPNALCVLRLIGAVVLVPVAMAGHRSAFLYLALVLFVTDWLDGKLARWLEQRTRLGATLDTVADGVLGGAILFGVWQLRPSIIQAEGVWIGLALGAWGLAVLVALYRFRRLPGYHNRLAKLSWSLGVVAVVAIFADGPAWVVRLALVAVALTNLEAVAITVILRRWRPDVPTFWHALRQPDQVDQEEPG